MIWARMLAYITGTVDRELLRNEYLTAENRILRAQIKGRLLLAEAEKATPRDLRNFDPSKLLAMSFRYQASSVSGFATADNSSKTTSKPVGDPRVDEETEWLVVRMAKENPGWGYDRIVGAMANLGLRLSDQTVGNCGEELRYDLSCSLLYAW